MSKFQTPEALQLSLIHSLLTRSLPKRSCLALENGDIVHLQSPWILDYGTLGESIRTARQYFSLEDQDIIILKNPSCGGGFQSDLTFVLSLRIGPQKFFLSIHKNILEPIDDFSREEIREGESFENIFSTMPPLPIYHNKQLNQGILMALESTPDSSSLCNDWICKSVDHLHSWSKNLKNSFNYLGLLPTSTLWKNYLNQCHDITQKQLLTFDHYEHQKEIRLNEKEFLKIDLFVKEAQIYINWSASPTFQSVKLYDHHVFGITVSQTLKNFKINFKNSGVCNIFRISKNHNSFLNTPAKDKISDQEIIQGVSYLTQIFQ